MPYINLTNPGWIDNAERIDRDEFVAFAEATRQMINERYVIPACWNNYNLIPNRRALETLLRICVLESDNTPVIYNVREQNLNGHVSSENVLRLVDAKAEGNRHLAGIEEEDKREDARAINLIVIKRGFTFAYTALGASERYTQNQVTAHIETLLGCKGKVYITADNKSIIAVAQTYPELDKLALFYACAATAVLGPKVADTCRLFYNNNFDAIMNKYQEKMEELTEARKVEKLKKAINRTKNQRKRTLTEEIKAYRETLTQLDARWKDTKELLTRTLHELKGLELETGEDDISQMFAELKHNKAAKLIDANDNYLIFDVITPLVAYRPSAVKPYIRNERHPIGASERLKYVFQKVFVEQEYKLNLEMKLLLPINANDTFRWETVQRNNTIPNPHIAQFNCWSQHRSAAMRKLAEGNLPDALTQCVLALGSIEFDDTAVVNVLTTYISERYWETKCFKNNEGVFVSAKDIWEAKE